jgi:hypothetical protein
VVGAKGDGDDEGDSSLFGEAVRNTSDRRTDPNMSCICERERGIMNDGVSGDEEERGDIMMEFPAMKKKCSVKILSFQSYSIR